MRLLSTLMLLVAGTSAASECNSELVEWVCAGGPDRVVLQRTFAGCQVKDLTSGVEEAVTCPPFDVEAQRVTCEPAKEVDLKASGFRLTVEPAGTVVGETGVKLEDVMLHRLVCPQRLTLMRNGAVVVRETVNIRCLAEGKRGEVRVDAYAAAPAGRLLVLVSVPSGFDDGGWCGEQRALTLAGLKSDRLVKGQRGGLVAGPRPQKAEFAALVRRQAVQACERGEGAAASATFELAKRFGAKAGTCADGSSPRAR